ncbi:Hypothetical protein FKW44_011860 [Caligus rogercresseyi]|uniref:Uncharacterized protein n=1 Tax=Caligus rogercresseyi TaxID=217165 RepID=A0A7T8KAJ0_CALRO|nr:Hypothetical protein FKW44_011860 [Caligus rogercresseyi]
MARHRHAVPEVAAPPLRPVAPLAENFLLGGAEPANPHIAAPQDAVPVQVLDPAVPVRAAAEDNEDGAPVDEGEAQGNANLVVQEAPALLEDPHHQGISF